MGPIPGNKLPGYDHSVPPGQSLTRPLRAVLAELPDVFIAFQAVALNMLAAAEASNLWTS
jgi:hypothetical protein